ncbi:uncharacterized protein LOC123321760 [Coccinella septempunctata]|uniref:uncharacterized protein LOC123321760 n=1 Tax=Coccinella septempunctata TaxID=41139 RepID=UPI001D07842F|nr:uncharacterized protein LOC123321760 [Coccinella septempunctata]
MNPAGDFEIINVLNPKSKSDLFLVKRLDTEDFFVWRTVSFKSISKDRKELLCKKIRKRIQQNHVLLVKFYPAIEEDKLKLVYVPMEYFPHGSLSDFLKVLAKSETSHIPEEMIVKILFQLLILVKSIELNDYIRLKNIYFDEDFNLKYLNFSQYTTQSKFDVKMCDIGIIIMQLCTLTEDKLCNKFIVNKEYYSEEFIDLIEIMLKDNKPAASNIDKIIAHPVILLNTFKMACGVKLNDCFALLDYRLKLEQLRKKEIALKLRENEIDRKEYSLSRKEKKLTMYEKALKEKSTQSQLYLKRCKENKSTHLNKYENLDTSLTVEYDEIEDTDIIQTSEKLDVAKLKHQPIAKTLSERKIKFKGHSPLKKISYNKTKLHKKPKDKEKPSMFSTDKTHTLNTEINLFKDIYNTDKIKNENCEDNRKSAVYVADLATVQNERILDMECRPIAWTEQNKKQAFELLRIMNSTSDKQFWSGEVRHTFL